MKFFTNKSIWSKIIILLIFVLLFQFIVTKPTLAGGAEVGEAVVEFGGKLMTPVLSLVVSIADAIMGLMHESIMGSDESILPIDIEASIWEILGKAFVVVVAVVAAIVTVVGAVASGAGIFALVGAIATGLAKIAAGATVGWIVVNMATSSVNGEMSELSASVFSENVQLPATVYLPTFSMSPEEIFQGKILLFNVDFFGEPKEIMAKGKDIDGNEVRESAEIVGTTDSKIVQVEKYYYEDGKDEIATSKQDIAADLQTTIARWYVGIRNIVLVGMMIVLLYIGIRMLLSTVASDKAKYKQFFQDWAVGLLLVFMMHYIMSFSVTIVQKITDVVASSVDSKGYAVKFPVDKDGKMVKFFNDQKMTYLVYDENGNCLGNEEGTQEVKASDAAYIIYPTNIIGKLRLDLQMTSWGAKYIGYSLAYLTLVLFTFYFAFTYLRRVLYMAFLTMIAPMVALTYPIDKINDGSAQGFSKWFKEYIFNLLIQPMHLLLYYVLVTSAFDLAGKNLIYSIVAIAFMIPAEKLLRSLFGFEKANTPGVLSGAAGAAITMGAISKLSGLGKGSSKGKSNGAIDNGESSNNNNKVRQQKLDGDVDETSVMAGTEKNYTYEDELEQKDIISEQKALEEQKKDARPEDQQSINELQKEIDERQAKIDSKKEADKKAQELIVEKENRKRKIPIRARAKDLGFKTLRRAANSNIPRKTIRTAGKIGGAVGLGAIGAAAGIASGDPSSVWTNGVAAAGAGYAAGKGISNGVANSIESPEISSWIDKKYQKQLAKDENMDALMQARQISNQRKLYIQKMKDNNFTKQDIKKMKDNGTIDRYISNEISVEDAVAGEKMRKNNSSLTQNEVIASAKYAERIGDAIKGPGREKWEKHISSEFVEKANLNKEQADKAAKQTLKKVDAFNKAKKKII